MRPRPQVFSAPPYTSRAPGPPDLQIYNTPHFPTQGYRTASSPSPTHTSPATPSPSPTLTERSDGNVKPRVPSLAVRTASALRRTGGATFRCSVPDCTSTFTTKVNLDGRPPLPSPASKLTPSAGHVRAHNGQKPYTCEHCVDSFARKADLRRHIKSKHDKERPFGCPHCNKKYARADALAQHGECPE